ncbi:MAG: sialidase family protein [Anaerolineales bacterium]
MNKLAKPLSIIGILVILLALIGVQIGIGQVGAPPFPESHKFILGASAYRALFGLNASYVAPGPHSSDTGTGTPPRVGPNIRVNDPQLPLPDGLLGRSETTIAASGNGNYLVVGWNDADGFCGPPWNAPCTPPPVPGLSGYAYSSDGGQTFTDGGVPFLVSTPGGDKLTRGDPSLDVGGYGNATFYYANMAVDTDPAGLGGMVVHSGSFQGKSFSWENGVFIPAPAPNDFLDKELLATDKRGNSQAVYVSVTNFIETCNQPGYGWGQIELYSSMDGGNTWSRTIIQPDETLITDPNDPACGADGVINQGSMPAVGTEGELYVVWERGYYAPIYGGYALPRATIVVATSSDQGASFTAPVEVASICSGALFPPAGYNRPTTNDFPRIAVAQSGPYRGRIYVTFQDCSAAYGDAPFGQDTDVYLSYSDDQGITWSTPTLVAGGADGLIQFWPTVSIQPGGNIDITYYESLEAEGTSFVNTYWAQSIDGGATFEAPVRVSDVTTDWGATASNIIPNFGDYNTAVSAGDRLFSTWADGRNGVPDTFFAKILTIGKAPR